MLDDLAELLVGLDDGVYARPCPRVMDSTIGKHTRHTLDHFAALLSNDSSVEPPCIDYDHRERDTAVEREVAAAHREIDRLRSAVQSAANVDSEQPVVVRGMLATDGRCADMPSSFVRELAFASHHALHHLAMIRLIAEALDVSVDASLGKAPSTLNHERVACAEVPISG